MLNIYRVCREDSAIHRENFPYVTLHGYDQTHLYPNFDPYGGNEKMSFKELQMFTYTDYKINIKTSRIL